jgi:type I restriction enzyme, S subunit
MDNLADKEWYEPTPVEWEIQRMKNIMDPREGRSELGEETLLSVTINEGIIKRSKYLNDDEGGSRAESLIGYKTVSPSNLVNNIMKMSFRCLGISDFEGIVSPAYSVFNLRRSKIDPIYLNFLLRTDRYVFEYRKLSKGIQESRMRLYDDYFLAMKVVVPPILEQQLISKYLDKKTKLIDSLVEKTQSKIELLKEQRTSLINQCVTKGLDPNVEMKDSGVEWIGEIPKNWKVKRLAVLGSFSKGKNITKSDLTKHGEPVILYSHLYTTYSRVTDSPDFHISLDRSLESTKISKNTFLFTSSGESVDEIGKTLLYSGTRDINVGGDVVIFCVKSKEDFYPEFFSFSFNSDCCQNQKSSMSRGEIVVHIYEKQLREIWVTVPPLSEQVELTRKLKKFEQSTERLVDTYNQKINTLKEYRQSLIASVVTGKVRVTEGLV